MKRLRVILLFLLLGAIVNVAVAWGCAAWSPLTKNTLHEQSNDYFRDYWLLHHPETYPPVIFQVQDEHRKGFGILNGYLMGVGGEQSYNLIFSATGWPMLSLRGCVWESRQTLRWSGHIVPDRIDGTIPLFLDRPEPYREPRQLRMLPLRPITFGFLANTLFYAGLLWLFIPGPFVLRRFIRRKCGHCVKCAYDLSGTDHEACPECGEEIRKGNPA